MLLGLLALPALAAIYWLRSRSRRVTVSSLILWADQRRARQGGLILQRMQAPLTFFLELLVIALLVAAAAGPSMLKREIVRPLVVVLDDSYSMLARLGARGQDSPRSRAAAAVQEELARNNYSARFILAGRGAAIDGRPAANAGSSPRCAGLLDVPTSLVRSGAGGGPGGRVGRPDGENPGAYRPRPGDDAR